jgi:hypothetical protein
MPKVTVVFEYDEKLPVAKRNLLRWILERRVEKIGRKFVKGAVEHGQSLEEIDIAKEIDGELTDLEIYAEMAAYKEAK